MAICEADVEILTIFADGKKKTDIDIWRALGGLAGEPVPMSPGRDLCAPLAAQGLLTRAGVLAPGYRITPRGRALLAGTPFDDRPPDDDELDAMLGAAPPAAPNARPTSLADDTALPRSLRDAIEGNRATAPRRPRTPPPEAPRPRPESPRAPVPDVPGHRPRPAAAPMPRHEGVAAKYVAEDRPWLGRQAGPVIAAVWIVALLVGLIHPFLLMLLCIPAIIVTVLAMRSSRSAVVGEMMRQGAPAAVTIPPPPPAMRRAPSEHVTPSGPAEPAAEASPVTRIAKTWRRYGELDVPHERHKGYFYRFLGFLGLFGVHRYYLGLYPSAVACTLAFVVMVITVIAGAATDKIFFVVAAGLFVVMTVLGIIDAFRAPKLVRRANQRLWRRWFDRAPGEWVTIEGTVRDLDQRGMQSYESQAGSVQRMLLNFRVEEIDDSGNVVRRTPVELVGNTYSGPLRVGDTVRLTGKRSRENIVRTLAVDNVSTSSKVVASFL